MLRNCLAATLRHLSRNQLHTAISVVGLALGLCVALLALLVVRNQYSYDRDVPNYERTWIALGVLTPQGLAPQYSGLTPSGLAEKLQIASPQVEAAIRVVEDDVRGIERDGMRWRETVHWADADLADILPLPVYAEDASAALNAADGLILSRGFARRFFGQDAPLGETLSIEGHPMVVRAVMEDPRPNTTHVLRNIIASEKASFSPDSIEAREPPRRSGYLKLVSGITYVRVKAGTDIKALQHAAQLLVAPKSDFPSMLSVEFVRIDRMNTHEGRSPGFRNRMIMLGILGAVVLLVAAVNFVNLQTARSTLRAREVAIRRVAGARRAGVMAQFLGEALIHAGVAALLAMALAEWLRPRVNAFLDAGVTLDYVREPWLVGAVLGAAVFVGLLAGAWPALVQSRVRPVDALRDKSPQVAGGGAVRQGLVALQFALLIALAICAGVVHRQREFALNEGLRMDHDQVLMVYASKSLAFSEEVRRLPGVRAVTRASVPFLGATGFGPLRGISVSMANTSDGKPVSARFVGVDFDLFDFYGIKPLAGVLPAADGKLSRRFLNYVVINETAARRFGLGTPAEALEKASPIGALGNSGTPDKPAPQARVLAVVPDFSLDSVAEAVQPTVYSQPEAEAELVSIRLSGRQIPETLAAIDSLWSKTGNTGPSDKPFRFFLDEKFERQYQGVLRQAQAFGICALIAIVLSCVGLFALTAANAELRTKEIGIRKALGASTGDVLKLLIWQFSKPVLWANLIAWPVAGYLMQRWLEGFAYHIDLPLWLFPAAAFAALAIALAAVSVHSILVARAKPVAALRHE